MNFSSGNCLQIQFIVDHQVSFASSIGTISIQCVCYAVVVLLCSCRVKDGRVVAMFKYYSAILWLEWKFLAFWITGSSTFFKYFRVSLEEFYLSARKLKCLGKIHTYLNTHIIFYIRHLLNRVVSLKLHRLVTSAVQQIVDAVIFLCLEDTYISRKTLTANPLLCIPSSTKKVKVQVHLWGKPVAQTLHQKA